MKTRKWYQRLNVQLVALLTLALFPLGSVAIFQTNRVATEADQNAGYAFLALTERAAKAEQVLIERAVGAATLFGSIAPDLIWAPETCEPILARFVEANKEYSFVGVIPKSGVVVCSSVSRIIDFSGYENFEENMAKQQPTIVANRDAPASNTSVFVVSVPFELEGEFAGFVSISIPHSSLPETSSKLEKLGLVELITFNANGNILTSRAGLGNLGNELPALTGLKELVDEEPITFRAQNQDGIERRYSVVAIEGSPAAVMAIWETDQSGIQSPSNGFGPAIFPTLMWLASMGVAMLAMQTLVLRHLRRLRRNMDRFADTRTVGWRGERSILTPIEIADLDNNFQRMSADIVADEARLENTLREKGVLVKEIHHRVKNNLQLISSIMNMQIRTAKHSETRQILRRLQDRVLSLATIHRDLYQSQDGGRVNAGELIQEIIEKSADVSFDDNNNVDVKMDIDHVRLFPDQAVPFSLLVAEAATNAMKFIADSADQTPMIDVSLKQDGTTCTFVFTNSYAEHSTAERTGLGAKLINAFAIQLGGKISIDQTDDHYTLTLTFDAMEFEPDTRDF